VPLTLASLPAATHVPAVRHFTRLFKRLAAIGFEHSSFILDSWAVVRGAALAHLEQTKQPGLANSIAFIDKLVGVAANLPKPQPRKEGEHDDDEDDEQQDLIAAEEPGEVKVP
jgi:hypothetical protein